MEETGADLMAAQGLPSGGRLMEISRDRRRTDGAHKIFRIMVAVFAETELDTMSIVVLSAQFAMVLALVIFNQRIVELPPPYFDNFILRLPVLMWSVSLTAGVGWQIHGWATGNDCSRRNGALLSSVVCCLLSGSVFNQAPGVAVLLALATGWQIVVAARLWQSCEIDAGAMRK